jgi:hypothetical protein
MAQVLQIRLPDDLREKVERIAETNHLSVPDVVRLILGQTLPRVEKDGLVIQPAAMGASEEGAAAA